MFVAPEYSDIKEGEVSSGLYTVGTTVVSIDIPDTAKGVKIKALINDVRFAVDENPVAAGSDALTTGAIAFAGETEVRTFRRPRTTLRLLGTTSTDVNVEFFGG